MQMHHVEVLVSQRSDGPQLRRHVGRDGCHRAVGCRGQTDPQGCDPSVWGWAVTRTQNPHIVPDGPQCPGQTQNLALDPAGEGQRVGRDDADAHAGSLGISGQACGT